jgi:hypothetical protein
MSFYVRQSGLIVPAVVFSFLLFTKSGRILDTAKCFGFFLVGYIGMNALVFAYYFRFMSLSELLATGMTPIGFIGSALERLLSLGEVSLGYAQTPSSQGFHVSWRLYLSYVIQAFCLHSFLLVALVLSMVISGRRLLVKGREDNRSVQIGSQSILYFWALFIFLAYAYYYDARGFFIDYFREFLPPLVIVFSAWICNSVSALKKDGAIEKFILGGMSLSAVLFFIHSHYKISFGMDLYALYMCIGIAVFVFYSFVRTFQSSGRRIVFMSVLLIIVISILVLYQTRLESNMDGVLKATASFIAILMTFGTTWVLLDSKINRSLTRFTNLASRSVVFGAFLASVSYSGALLDIEYHSVWSPESVKQTAEYLERHTDIGDDVMSGAVIWELQANRRPFKMISHPLRFLYGIEDQESEDIIRSIQLQPPKVIILDGYTEKTYVKYIPSLNEILMEKYELKMTAGPAKYPIRLFKLKETPALSRAFSAIS